MLATPPGVAKDEPQTSELVRNFSSVGNVRSTCSSLVSGSPTPAWQDLASNIEVVQVDSTPRFLLDNELKKHRQVARSKPLDVLLGTRRGQWVTLLCVGGTLVSTGAVAWSWSGGIPGTNSSWGHSLWMSWCLFFDPGTQTGISPDDPAVVRWVALIFSVLGFIYNLSVLGIIVETARGLLRGWEQDRYKIVLNGHLLVLGWTDKTLFLLREVLAEAENMGVRQQRVVILADIDEREMNEQVRDHIGDTKGHYVKCRKGCIFNPKDLMRVSVYSARDVIVLARGGPADAADLEVVRVMVALAALPMELSSRVLAEVRCASMAPVIEALLPNICEGIHARSTINRLLCLMAVSPVIGDCLASLCCFDYGEELYLAHLPELTGLTFGEACLRFARPILVGLKPERTNVLLAPPDGRVIESTDRMVLLSPDMKTIGMTQGGRTVFGLAKQVDSQVRLQANRIAEVTTGKISRFVADQRWDADIDNVQHVHRLSATPLTMQKVRSPHYIVIGWPDDIGELLFTFDLCVPEGTTVHLLCDRDVQEREDYLMKSKVLLKNTTLEHYVGKCTSVEWLSALPLAEASSILIFSEGGTSMATRPPQQAGTALEPELSSPGSIASDSACLACAVTICGICDGRFGVSLACRLRGRIICEVIDLRTDRMLLRNRALGKRCVFFRSNALEMGLFAMATSEPTIFNLLVSLISPVGHSGHLTSLSVGDLLPVMSNSMRVSGPDPSFVWLSFWDLNGLVRQHCDAMLIGWQKAETGQWVLCPTGHRGDALLWCLQDLVLVIHNVESDDSEPTEEAEKATASGSGGKRWVDKADFISEEPVVSGTSSAPLVRYSPSGGSGPGPVRRSTTTVEDFKTVVPAPRLLSVPHRSRTGVDLN